MTSAIHVSDVGFAQASGERIVEYALEYDDVIISADTDFAATLLDSIVRSRRSCSSGTSTYRVTVPVEDQPWGWGATRFRALRK